VKFLASCSRSGPQQTGPAAAPTPPPARSAGAGPADRRSILDFVVVLPRTLAQQTVRSRRVANLRSAPRRPTKFRNGGSGCGRPMGADRTGGGARLGAGGRAAAAAPGPLAGAGDHRPHSQVCSGCCAQSSAGGNPPGPKQLCTCFGPRRSFNQQIEPIAKGLHVNDSPPTAQSSGSGRHAAQPPAAQPARPELPFQLEAGLPRLRAPLLTRGECTGGAASASTKIRGGHTVS